MLVISISFSFSIVLPEAQPKSYRPFVHYDCTSGAYQWIGSGQDSDINLGDLTQWWLERRNDQLKSRTSQIRPMSSEETAAFHRQEQQRFANPSQLFSQTVRGQNALLGPVVQDVSTRPRRSFLAFQISSVRAAFFSFSGRKKETWCILHYPRSSTLGLLPGTSG